MKAQYGWLKVFLTPVPDIDRKSPEWVAWCLANSVDPRGYWIASASCYLRVSDVLISDAEGELPFAAERMADGNVALDSPDAAADGQLMSLYAAFSEAYYAAGWMTPSDVVMGHFREWLLSFMRRGAEYYESAALPELRAAWRDARKDLNAEGR